MKKYKFIKEYKRFNLWLNTKNGCKECFDKNIDPNRNNVSFKHENEKEITWFS